MSRFSKQADFYAQYRPDYPTGMYNFIFNHLSSRHFAWDCATGSGQVAKYLANHFKKVFATDISSEQLNFAPEIPNIEYRIAAAEDSGLPANQFDLITVAQAIHWFDFDQFYDEVRRVAKDGALLTAIGYGMIRINKKIDPILNELYQEAFDAYYIENRRFIDQQYQTIPFPFEEIPCPTFNNTFIWSFSELEGFLNSWSSVQKLKSNEGYNPVTGTMKKLRKEISNDQNIEVSFPVFMRLGKL